jgi:hypothetical protein
MLRKSRPIDLFATGGDREKKKKTKETIKTKSKYLLICHRRIM